LLNCILGTKVAITSDKPQTTRSQIRGVLNRPDLQIVFVDTPGIHKPRTLLGERLNARAKELTSGPDVVCLVVDATGPIGPGDRFVAEQVPSDAIIIVNKTDIASADEVMIQLARAAEQLNLSAYFPVSAKTGEGVDELLAEITSRLPDGPAWYPEDAVTDVPEAFWVAELVREQLLAVTNDELPHSIATRVVEWEWPRIRVEILVERDSQKGIVIGHKGSVLKQVGIAVREQLPEGAFIELFVKVDKDWQRKAPSLDRLGF
jgi:GTP-binding protein Era